MVDWTTRAAEEGADLICFPELADHRLSARGPGPSAALRRGQPRCARRTGRRDRRIVMRGDGRVRGPHRTRVCTTPPRCIRDGRVQERYHKIQLPNYGVFDEKRYFVPGTAACSVRLASSELGLSVCEDAWYGDAPFDEYERTRPPGHPEHQRLAVPPRQGRGATGDLPSSRTADRRMDRLRERGRRPGRARVRRRLDGRVSGREVIARAAMFEEDLVVVKIDAARRARSSEHRTVVARRARRRSTGRSSWASGTTSGRTGSARW